jgi:ATP-dependent exoDNAse (exonuclease V) beta subunit
LLKPPSAQGRAIGTLFHAWLEQIEWLGGGLPGDDALRRIAARLRSEIGDVAEKIDEHIERFKRQLAARSVAAALSQSFYDSPANLGLAALASKTWPAGRSELTVQRELAFATRNGEGLLVGSIDRLVVINRGGKPVAADIIDYKTDEIAASNAASLADKVAFYRPQIEAYRAAAAKLLDLPPELIAARLVFLAAGEVRPV